MRSLKPRIAFNSLHRIALAALVMLFLRSAPSVAQQQKGFATPEEAANALVTAAQKNDEAAMLAVLGPDARRIVSSGDDAEDAESRANFVKKYEEMHRLVKEPNRTVVLYIGAENWPTPIPLVRRGSSWYFDSEAGKQEILFRRIGRNEVSAIRICQELVAAQKEYYADNHNEYARKVFSDEGQHNGLYWQAAGGTPPSPIGPLVAAAVTGGSATRNGTPSPYRGYYYRILTAQGKHAPGGARSYVVDGRMTQGFAFIAYPAEYRSSGVMTFIVSNDGVVYERDLGKKTEAVVNAMKDFDPGLGWKKAETGGENAQAAAK
jgi:hypothetical protein